MPPVARVPGRLLPFLIVAAAALAAATRAPAQPYEERLTFPGDRLTLHSPIGSIRVEPAPGPGVEVLVSVRGKDASRETVSIDRKEGEDPQVAIRLPVEKSRRYVYPPMGRGKGTFQLQEKPGEPRSLLAAIFGRDEIRVSGEGRGLEIWADVSIRVPAGGSVEIHGGVGSGMASSLRADLGVEIQGGSFEVRDHHGKARIETGTGSIRIQGSEGDLHAASGTGSIAFAGVRGGDVLIEAGTGNVEGDIPGAGRVDLETGTGRIAVSLGAALAGPVTIESGTGDVSVTLPAGAPVALEAGSGTGAVSVDLPGAATPVREPRRVRAEVGPGSLRMTIETGTGKITVTPTPSPERVP